MCARSPSELIVPSRLNRGGHRDRQRWIESAHFAIELLSRTAGRPDLGGVELLDVGCGTKVTKAFLDASLPIGRYVGVDVSSEVIDWLRRNVTDPRFEYHHLPVVNALYNPQGMPLRDVGSLPVGERQFDLISLFSVFTHLDPDDYVAMLKVVRTHVKPSGRLLFSVFLDGYSRDRPLAKLLEANLSSDDPDVVQRTRDAIARAVPPGRDPRFTDAIPDKPLMQARYCTDYALELIQGTGWNVESVNEPVSPHIQHYIICTPA